MHLASSRPPSGYRNPRNRNRYREAAFAYRRRRAEASQVGLAHDDATAAIDAAFWAQGFDWELVDRATLPADLVALDREYAELGVRAREARARLDAALLELQLTAPTDPKDQSERKALIDSHLEWQRRHALGRWERELS